MTGTERRVAALGYRMLRSYVPATGWAPHPFAVVRLVNGEPDPHREPITFGSFSALRRWLKDEEARQQRDGGTGLPGEAVGAD